MNRALSVSLCLITLLFCAPYSASADTVRVATFNTELSRKGPGLLLADIEKGDAGDVNAVADIIVQARADIIALQGIDWDFEHQTAKALARLISLRGMDYPYLHSQRPNSGLQTTLDLDGDGRTGGPGDAQGYGRFTGQGGLLILSRYPILHDDVQDFSTLLWRDLPGSALPQYPDGRPFPSDAAQQAQRLSSTGHWIVPVRLPDGQILRILTFQAGPPVFDGPEDRNGLRNRDEVRLWQQLLNGALGPVPPPPFVIAGGANLDPEQGEGRRQAIHDLLNDPKVQNLHPMGQQTVPSSATVDWPEVGQLRVDYLLPSADLQVKDTAVFWPAKGTEAAALMSKASRHRLVWVDLILE